MRSTVNRHTARKRNRLKIETQSELNCLGTVT